MKLLVWFGAFFALGWSVVAAPLIVDHTCVDLYTNLTSADIVRVKSMWVDILGASHSLGYRVGCQLLENQDPRFQVNATESGPMESYTTNHLRISRAYWYGGWGYGGNEKTWYTSAADIELTKAHLSYSNTNGYRLSVFGYGWSWQPSWHNLPGGPIDPTHHVQWAGSSEGGPDGDLRWGLDASSYNVTSNRVSMDTYLEATEQYRRHCRSNGYGTTVIFTTAPVDYLGDAAYQAYLKNNHIRSYVSNTTDAVLFDYADILCWDDFGNRKTNGWTDLAGNSKFYEWIAGDNYLNLDGNFGGGRPEHIGERGELRLAKALWYMLARLSESTEPEPPFTPAISITSDSHIAIQWPSQVDAVYSILHSADLASDGWAVLASGIAATPPMNSYTGAVSRAQSAWFRVRKD